MKAIKATAMICVRILQYYDTTMIVLYFDSFASLLKCCCVLQDQLIGSIEVELLVKNSMLIYIFFDPFIPAE